MKDRRTDLMNDRRTDRLDEGQTDLMKDRRTDRLDEGQTDLMKDRRSDRLDEGQKDRQTRQFQYTNFVTGVQGKIIPHSSRAKDALLACPLIPHPHPARPATPPNLTPPQPSSMIPVVISSMMDAKLGTVDTELLGKKERIECHDTKWHCATSTRIHAF